MLRGVVRCCWRGAVLQIGIAQCPPLASARESKDHSAGHCFLPLPAGAGSVAGLLFGSGPRRARAQLSCGRGGPGDVSGNGSMIASRSFARARGGQKGQGHAVFSTVPPFCGTSSAWGQDALPARACARLQAHHQGLRRGAGPGPQLTRAPDRAGGNSHSGRQDAHQVEDISQSYRDGHTRKQGFARQATHRR